MAKRKPTFKEIQESAKAQMDRNLMARGRQASRIAKLVHGGNRRKLYAVKNKALAHLIAQGRASIGTDKGLLSIRVRGQGALHTHEGWLEPHLDRDLRAGTNDQKKEGS